MKFNSVVNYKAADSTAWDKRLLSLYVRASFENKYERKSFVRKHGIPDSASFRMFVRFDVVPHGHYVQSNLVHLYGECADGSTLKATIRSSRPLRGATRGIRDFVESYCNGTESI